jgi:microcystin-dependent protein
MSEPFIGEIRMVGFNFAPQGWALCQGQLLSIASNTALFSLLGTMYGGNGVQTFGLPDLRGRVPINFGQGPGLPAYVQGQVGGQTAVTLLQNNLPAHTHLVAPQVSGANGTSSSPVNNYPAADVTSTSSREVSATTMSYAAQSAATQAGGAFQSGVTGGNLPVDIEQPYLVLNFIIALYGTFPSRG